MTTAELQRATPPWGRPFISRDLIVVQDPGDIFTHEHESSPREKKRGN
jgi:hypothetical protein